MTQIPPLPERPERPSEELERRVRHLEEIVLGLLTKSGMGVTEARLSGQWRHLQYDDERNQMP